MTETIPVDVIEIPEAEDSEEDIVITDISRPRDSRREIQQYEKWKQKLRIELIREQFAAQKKKSAARKPFFDKLSGSA